MANTVTLIIPAGTLGYAISHGNREFPVYGKRCFCTLCPRPDG